MNSGLTKCGECGGSEYLRERRWGFGRKRFWFCDMCFKVVAPVIALEEHPDLSELDAMLNGFYGEHRPQIEVPS